jgi:cell division protein FtsB
VLRKTFHDRRSRQERRSALRTKQAFVLLACCSATAYFAHHALYGRHGINARDELLERSALLDFELKSLDTVRAKLTHDVALLSPELPNDDLVEEIARDVLGYVRPEDRIVRVP